MNILCSFRSISSFGRALLVLFLLCVYLLGNIQPVSAVTQVDIIGPPGSGKFGTSVTALPNGNFVVTDPYFNGGIAVDAGAVYLYDGATRTIISTLTGTSTGDKIGYGGVTVLSNGNYVISSIYWDNGIATDAGAVTWGDQDTGVNGVVSAANSLVGTMSSSEIGGIGVVALTNGNYVVVSSFWDNPIIPNAGAVTWGDGETGISGPVSVANSLLGTMGGDMIGLGGVVALTNGNYVVCSPNWNNGGISDVGAATWGDGQSGTTTGLVSASNSMVGSAADDQVCGSGAIALSNGNYVVNSPEWNNGAFADAGAATWGDGATGTSGPLSALNSLVGSQTDDGENQHVFALTNGHYVVAKPYWDNGAIADAGAATWGNGTTGTSGGVFASNSLVGSKVDDWVGFSVTALEKGNYVVRSPWWTNGAITSAGAATWRKGSSSTSGTVSATNSLVGSHNNDQVGLFATALENGNYVVGSPYWDKGLVSDAGAATWVSGASSFAGAVSTSNSLVGSKTGDQIGLYVTALSNGNYVVASPDWDNGAAANSGAATWGDGAGGTTGSVTPANSLVGSDLWHNDRVGRYEVTALANGNYVVRSPEWNNGAIDTAGAATWGNGATGIVGQVSSANSLVGDSSGDNVGGIVIALNNGAYIVRNMEWDGSGGTTDAGAVTWGWGAGGTIGSITLQNSVIGIAANGGSSMVYAFDAVHMQLVVGRPADNIVTIFQLHGLKLPLIKNP